MNMFWVYKDFFRSRGTQCILNQGRTTHKKKRRASRWTTMAFFKSGQNQTKIESEIFIFQRFLRVFADFTSMKNFLWHLWTCSEYVKVFSEGEEHNAFESGTYDTKNQKTARFNTNNYDFFEIKSEMFIFKRFLRVFADFTSMKKISMAFMNMFWVCKSSFIGRGTQCTLNQGRTTHRKNDAFQGNNCPKTGTDLHLIKGLTLASLFIKNNFFHLQVLNPLP